MVKNDPAHSDSALSDLASQPHQTRSVEIADAFPMRLYVLDLARHTIIAPDGNRFVVATVDDTRLGRGYITAVYPQQNGYLTLIRLMVCEFSSATPDEAIKRHITVAQTIQQGNMKKLTKLPLTKS
jgi:hypothetical protein